MGPFSPQGLRETLPPQRRSGSSTTDDRSTSNRPFRCSPRPHRVSPLSLSEKTFLSVLGAGKVPEDSVLPVSRARYHATPTGGPDRVGSERGVSGNKGGQVLARGPFGHPFPDRTPTTPGAPPLDPNGDLETRDRCVGPSSKRPESRGEVGGRPGGSDRPPSPLKEPDDPGSHQEGRVTHVHTGRVDDSKVGPGGVSTRDGRDTGCDGPSPGVETEKS